MEVSYFSQNHADELDPKRTVLETVQAGVGSEASGNLRTLLGAFLFRGDDVFKSVGVLSGGERSRLALARMLMRPANFLILDEPTNHLDMQSQEVLQRALADYTGTYVIVSHNRSFLDPIVTKVLEFIPQQPMRMFIGNVGDYLEKKAEELAAEAGRTANAGSQSKGGGTSAAPQSGSNRKEQRRREAQERQKKAETLKPLKKRLSELESRVETLETEKNELTQKLVDPDFFKQGDVAAEASERFHKVESELENAYTDWNRLTEKIEEAEAGFASETTPAT